MKRNLMGVFLVLSAVAALLPTPSPGQTPPVGRTLIYSLEPGEEIMSSDGKKYAMSDYEHIAFSDGQKFPSPLDIVVFAKNGQTVFKRITLENKKDLVVYQRAM